MRDFTPALVWMSLVGLAVSGCSGDSGGGEGAVGSTSAVAAVSGQFAGAVAAMNPPAPAPLSVIDPQDPWSALGELTGTYSLRVERLSHDCQYGPDVPLSQHYYGSDPSVWVVSQDYTIEIVQRGRALAFSLDEGVVLATYDEASSRIADVERVGAEGITEYREGFAVNRSQLGRISIEGESQWTFEGDHYRRGEPLWWAYALVG